MDAEFEREPETEPSAALEPPRRRPPTAVGTGRRPPREPDDGGDIVPFDDGEPYGEYMQHFLRVARALLALVALIAGLALLWPLRWQTLAGVSAVMVAQSLWRLALIRSERRAAEQGSSAVEHSQGERPPRSA